MINDETFKTELDGLLKRQGFKKRDRQEKIQHYCSYSYINERNEILEINEQAARDVELQKQQSKKIKSEFEEQCLFIAWFKKEFPTIKIMSIRNHGTRTPREKVDQMREGLLPGASDLYIPYYHLWIEFKRSKGGLLSAEQEDFRDYVTDECGDYYILAEGCENGRLALLEFLGKI